jgi:tetratricopeptide (TPR) repeat protein
MPSQLLLLLTLLLPASQLLAQSPDAIQKYAEQGQRALLSHDYAAAAQAFEKVRQLAPDTAEVYAQLGFIYFQQRRYEQSVTSLRRAIKLKPDLPNTGLLLAMSLSELGRFTEALPGLDKGFHKTTDLALKRLAGLQLERAYTGLGKDDKAVEVALEMSRLFPDDPEVLYQTGRLYGNFAYLSMKRLADVAPSSVWRHQAAAEAHQSAGNYDSAISEYRWVLEADPARPGIHLQLGRTLLARARQNSQEPNDALKEFEAELKLDPTNANAAYEAADIHRKAGRNEEARVLFEAAVKSYPDFEEAHVGLGATLLALGRPADAVPPLRRATGLDPSDDVAYYRLSQAYRLLGNEVELRKSLAEFRRLRDEKAKQAASQSIVRRSEVTAQELDPKAGDIPK